jgi:tetratricopeptide (TPR) repeat protein
MKNCKKLNSAALRRGFVSGLAILLLGSPVLAFSALSEDSVPAASSTDAKLHFFSDTIDDGMGGIAVNVCYTVGGIKHRNRLIEGIEQLGKDYPAKFRADTISKRLNDLYNQQPEAFKNLYKDNTNGFPVISAPGLKPLVTMDKKMIENNASACGTDSSQAMDWLITQILQAVKGKTRDFVPISDLKLEDKLEVANGYRQNGDDAFLDNRLQEAAQRYNQALALNPNYVEAYLRLSAVYLKEGSKDKALSALQTAKTKSPTDDQQKVIDSLTSQTH